jgi:hypothetical protein
MKTMTHTEQLRDMAAQIQTPSSNSKRFFNEVADELEALRKDLDRANLSVLELGKALEEAQEHDKEIGEFQDEVRCLVIKLSGAPDEWIDGKGSDAGWQEFTLAEIEQGFSYLKDKLEAFSNPSLKASGARAIAYHLRQGEPFAGLSKEALANWVDELAIGFETISTICGEGK